MAENKVALVAGGSGGIGEGIVASLMDSGYSVYVPSRAGDQSDRLRNYVGEKGELHTIPADLSSEADVVSMRDRIVAEKGRIDTVIVSVGAYYYGYRMHRMPKKDWDKSVQDNLNTHFNLQRAFLDFLRQQNEGSYITLIGPESETILPEEGVMSIMAAAQKMMARVMANQAFDTNLRIYAVTSRTSIKTRSRGVEANPDWITALDLGRYIGALAEAKLPNTDQVLHELRDQTQVEAVLNRVQ